ncbi:MAG: GyrI-like domain-containing protein [Desulfocapsaceae bacterium]|nr:GyrI-like domain-containing protein [Desulfocapsaceae bacterium]
MIMQPKLVTGELACEAITQVRKKKNTGSLGSLRFEAFTEGKAAQILHVGPFSEEGPTMQKVHDFIRAAGGSLSGKHHEIYLSDIRKAAPSFWSSMCRKTIPD